MRIISHRGYWGNIAEKNTESAFRKSFSAGFGTETDFRDFDRELVISHDMADMHCMRAKAFFDLFTSYNRELLLAINIKADGLQKQLRSLVEQYNISEYFVFDMSIPDTLGYIKEGMKFFSRHSEYERIPAFYEECHGIWLDAFATQWYDADVIKKHLDNNKEVAIVSPELHQKGYEACWEMIIKNQLDKSEKLILCTDVPEAAHSFFN